MVGFKKKKKITSSNTKIQIRSFVKGGNHGQYIQALGLRELVRSICLDARVSHLNYTNHFWKELDIQIRELHLPKFVALAYFWYKRFEFSSFQFSPDISIYGSDMIWHQESDLFPVDPVFFGDRDNSTQKIAFAPSVASRGCNENRRVSNKLSSFSAIGVRDKGTSDFVKQYTGKIVPCVIDPCFFLLHSKYSGLIKSKKRLDFITIYSGYPKKMKTLFEKNLVQNKTPEYCFKSEYLGYFPRSNFFNGFKKQISDPLWTVKQIASSKLLLTSTFHGVMMALMTNTPFIAVKNSNLIARLRSPISNCFAPHRLIELESLKRLNNKSVRPFLRGNDLDRLYLFKYMEQSKEWLKNAIKIT